MEWVTVYDFQLDDTRAESLQEATLTAPVGGLVAEPAMVGTDEWWSAVADGRVETHTIEGIVADVSWVNMGRAPMWMFRAEGGEQSFWPRAGDHTRYVVGLTARITYAVVSWKTDSDLVRSFASPWHNMLLRVDLENSPTRAH
jgi:hypothetical protein